MNRLLYTGKWNVSVNFFSVQIHYGTRAGATPDNRSGAYTTSLTSAASCTGVFGYPAGDSLVPSEREGWVTHVE
jgi:hypothetical protein